MASPKARLSSPQGDEQRSVQNLELIRLVYNDGAMKKFIAPLLLFVVSLGIYLATLAPTVVTVFDDSLELQLALPTFAIVHPTGYPLYTLLGWLLTVIVPFGDAAYRVNLFSALAASGAVVLVYAVARCLDAATVPASVAALLFAISPVWWSQATIAEVYDLQGPLTLLVVYTLLRWDAATGGERERWLVLAGLSIGLGAEGRDQGNFHVCFQKADWSSLESFLRTHWPH